MLVYWLKTVKGSGGLRFEPVFIGVARMSTEIPELFRRAGVRLTGRTSYAVVKGTPKGRYMEIYRGSKLMQRHIENYVRQVLEIFEDAAKRKDLTVEYGFEDEDVMKKGILEEDEEE